MNSTHTAAGELSHSEAEVPSTHMLLDITDKSGTARPHHPMRPIDLEETDDGYVAYLYIHTCPEALLNVRVNDGMLYICRVDGVPIHYSRFNQHGSFSYGFLLPPNANSENIRAYRQEDLLKVEIAKH